MKGVPSLAGLTAVVHRNIRWTRISERREAVVARQTRISGFNWAVQYAPPSQTCLLLLPTGARIAQVESDSFMPVSVAYAHFL